MGELYNGYKGDQPVVDYNEVAKEMNCSKALLYRLEEITDLDDKFEKSNSLIWNKDCRFCGRTYYSGDVCIVLYFDIKGNYSFFLGFCCKKNMELENLLKSNHQQFFYKCYDIDARTKEEWLYIELDKFMLFRSCYDSDSSKSPKNELKEMIELYKGINN